MAADQIPDANSRPFPEAAPTGKTKTENTTPRPLGLGAGCFPMPENFDRIEAEEIEELFLGSPN